MKKGIAMLLAALLAVSLLTAGAFAAGTPADETAWSETTQAVSAAVQTIGERISGGKLLGSVGDLTYREVENNNYYYQANWIYHDYTVNGNVANADLDWYTFEISEPNTVSVTAVGDRSGLLFAIYDRYGETILAAARAENAGDYYGGDIVWDLPAGRYTLVFVSEHRHSIDYTYYFETSPVPTSGTCGGNVRWSLGGNGTLTVSGTGAMTDYETDYDPAPWVAHADSINKVVIGSGVTAIGECAFEGCVNLASVEIPNSVKTIGYAAFFYCPNLTEVNIPSSVQSIGLYAFGATGLTCVNIPASAGSVGLYAFDYCEQLTEITVAPGNANYIAVDGVLFNKDKTVLIEYPAASGRTVYTVPDGVIRIHDGAFDSCVNLTSVELSESVTSIGPRAFELCGKLNSVYIPVGVTAIDAEGMFDETPIETIDFGGTEAQWNAFGIELPEGAEVRCNVKLLGAPTVATGTNAATGKPVISWQAVAGATGYEVYRCDTKGGTYTRLIATTKLSVTHTGAKLGEDYFYKVRAVSGTRKGDFSGARGVWCDLPRPSMSVTTSASTGKPVISWNEVAGATGYKVYRCDTSKGTYTLLYTAKADKLSVTHTGAVVGNDYFYKVKAVYADNSSCDSALTDYKGVWCDLAAPTIKVTNNKTSGKPVISWNAVAGATGYEVYRCGTSKGTYTLLYTAKADKLSVTHTGAVAGQDYFYKVKAIYGGNSKCDSALSGYKGVWCDLARPELNVELNARGKPYLSWSEVTGADGYEVYRSTDGENWSLMFSAPADDWDVNHTGAAANTTYYYKVIAICDASAKSNSAYSAVRTITTE